MRLLKSKQVSAVVWKWGTDPEKKQKQKKSSVWNAAENRLTSAFSDPYITDSLIQLLQYVEQSDHKQQLETDTSLGWLLIG